MGPGQVAGERAQEQCGGGPAGVAGRVVGVGDVAVQLVGVLPVQRHAPDPLAGVQRGGRQRGGEAVGGGVQPGRPGAQRDLHRPGQGGDVDQHRGAQAQAGVGQAVGEDHPALGVGVPHLGGAPPDVPHDVGRPIGRAGHRVLRGRDDGGHRDGELQAGGGIERAEHRRSPGHVGLHLAHAGTVLDLDAAGVEGDALAHQRRPGRAGTGRLVRGDDDPRRGRRAAADGEHAAEAARSELLGAEHGDGHVRQAGEPRDGLLRQPGRVPGVRRGVDQVAGPGDGGGGDLPGPCRGDDGGVRGTGGDEGDGGQPRRVRLAALAEAVAGQDRGLDGGADLVGPGGGDGAVEGQDEPGGAVLGEGLRAAHRGGDVAAQVRQRPVTRPDRDDAARPAARDRQVGDGPGPAGVPGVGQRAGQQPGGHRREGAGGR
ncbi:hypothetical protein JD79_00273 [Geodermatophilus normandii]|uniref:Uncharacterized protein n=1 Tax=Geodermatophilus normandii TaxID=1137989 RepID=A0A317QFQ7_9ACTN|nr:hypothetical protein JD79_00273 [Geodermatophilus normandii]